MLFYKTDDGQVKVDSILENETIWLSQAQMASLFDVQRSAVTKHLKNIFESGELEESVVCSNFEHTTKHGAIQMLRIWDLPLVGDQWSDKLDAFLEFYEQELLTHAGKIKAQVAKKIAEDRYEEFNQKRKTREAMDADEDDFRELEEIEKNLLS